MDLKAVVEVACVLVLPMLHVSCERALFDCRDCQDEIEPVCSKPRGCAREQLKQGPLNTVTLPKQTGLHHRLERLQLSALMLHEHLQFMLDTSLLLDEALHQASNLRRECQGVSQHD